jgi:hypothetical protein
MTGLCHLTLRRSTDFRARYKKPDDFDVLTNGYTEEMLSDRISFKVPMQ